MKPRTFRRVVLLGSLGAIILIVALGYFVVRPWQNQRQLEAMRTNGIAAYENGEYLDTMRLLGRYTNNAEQFEPELYLKLARAAEKYEANDGGNILIAANAYREYLRRVPGDVEAKQELLPLLIASGKFVEAKSLANELRNEHNIEKIDLLQQLRYILRAELASDTELEPVLKAAFDHEDSGYSDANVYLQFLYSRERDEEAYALLDERIAAHQGRLQEQLLDFGRRLREYGDEMTNPEVTDELSAIIGLGAKTGEWAPDAPDMTAEEASYVSRVYDAAFRSDLGTSVLLRSAIEHQDFVNTVWAARRLYWASRDEQLLELSVVTPKDEPDSDMLGYQYLSAKRNADEALIAEKLAQLEEVELDRRGRAWKQYIDGLSAFDDGDEFSARVAIEKASKIYPDEPTFRLTMGDLQAAQENLQDAVEQWVISSEIVNGEVGAEKRFTRRAWPTPMMRVVNAYAEEGRLNEALDYIDELEAIAPLVQSGDKDWQGPGAAILLLNARAALARQGQLPLGIAEEMLKKWPENAQQMSPEARALISPWVAEIFGAARFRDAAKRELLFGLESLREDTRFATEYPGLVSQLAEVDARYGLGALTEAGLSEEDIVSSTPGLALRRAVEMVQNGDSLDDALLVFDESMARSEAENDFDWILARTRFVDNTDRDRAVEIWEQLLAENPDDVDLLVEAIDSNAFASDLERVDQLINKFVEMTSTAGKTIPTRLRLARANAYVSGPESRTRSNRASAIEIVRSVVANEPQNAKARNMLGRLLSLSPSPGIPESDRFEPDYQGAIDQYMTLSRQLRGSAARTYVLESFDLAFDMGDETQARDLLREYESRFGSDVFALPTIAERYEDLGDIDRAADLYQRVFGSEGIIDAGLSLADMRLKQGQTGQGKSLLDRIRQQDELSTQSVLRLASLYARSGNVPEGEQVILDAQRYGLSELDMKLAYADFAGLYISREAQVDALKEATRVDPMYRPAWKKLIQKLIELGRTEEAQQAFKEASSNVETDDELARYGVLAQGTPETAEEMLQLPGMQNPVMRQMIERVGAYDQLDPDTGTQERLGLLSGMIRDYPQIEVLQVFCVRELAALNISSREELVECAELAEEALRNVPANSLIMGLAGEFYLRLNQPRDVMRAIALWRANSLESSIVANAINAKALIQLGQYSRAEQELVMYVDEAVRNADEAVSREVLDAFSYTRLKQGEDPSITAERLRPLLETNPELRNKTWLRLATTEIEDIATAKEWIRTAESYATDEDRLLIANAWISLAFNHEVWDPEIAQAANQQLEPLVQNDEAGASPYIFLGRAHVIRARSSDDPGVSSGHYSRAIEALLHAADVDPTNLLPLLDAARFAAEGGFNTEAVSVYQRIHDLGLPEGQIKAMVCNNLAMARLRAGISDADAQAMNQLVEEATRIQPDVASYWGTRGWVELHFEQFDAAQASFQRAVDLTPDGAEGLAGLLIVLKSKGQADSSQAQRLRAQLRDLRAAGNVPAEVQDRLARHDLVE